MPEPRIYTNSDLNLGEEFSLDDTAHNHLVRVLRMENLDNFRVFNGNGYEYRAELQVAGKKKASGKIIDELKLDAPLKIRIHLGQVISKGDRMDFTIQKATELGVAEITPLWSERCDVRLKGERLDKKLQHWRRVAISACEQSGRNQIPTIHTPRTLEDWITNTDATQKLLLHPHNQRPLTSDTNPDSVALLVGPEGGFSDIEVEFCHQHQFEGLLLGPRILRTETAALSAISIFQYLWGDFR